MHIQPKIPKTLLLDDLKIETPAIIYDYDSINFTILQIKKDIQDIPNVQLCFSIKANRNPVILKILQELNVGADVASIHELKAGLEAKMSPIFATSPAFSNTDFDMLYKEKIIPDFNSISQIKNYFADKSSKDIGIRINLPIILSKEERETTFGSNSRFGISLENEDLFDLIKIKNLRVKQLHIHLGEIRNADIMKSVMQILESKIQLFPFLESINLGGGLTYLYSDENQVTKCWDLVSESMKKINTHYKNDIQVVIEPGMLLLAMSGYLYSKVVAADQKEEKRFVTLDSSAWNLTYWSYPVLIKSYTANTKVLNQTIVGNTCYEHDVFINNVVCEKLNIQDKVLLNPVGAYSSSMARNLHGFPLPQEWILKDNHFLKAGIENVTHY